MEWKDVGNLLGRAIELLHGERFFKKTVAEVVASVLNVKVLESEVTLKNGVVYIKAPPLVKGEIFLRKKVLLELINKNNPTKRVADLR